MMHSPAVSAVAGYQVRSTGVLRKINAAAATPLYKLAGAKSLHHDATAEPT